MPSAGLEPRISSTATSALDRLAIAVPTFLFFLSSIRAVPFSYTLFNKLGELEMSALFFE